MDNMAPAHSILLALTTIILTLHPGLYSIDMMFSYNLLSVSEVTCYK